MNGDNKSALGSSTIVASGIVILASLAALAGYTISGDDQAALNNLINSGLVLATSAASLAGGAVAIWGRVRATKPITSVMPKKTTG